MVDYTGLKKRDTYDEIVAIIQTDRTKIRYPNRVALQMTNSPYMKQVDDETMMDMEAQQNRMAKQTLKNLLLRQQSTMTGIPHAELRAEASPDQGVLGQVEAEKEKKRKMDEEVQKNERVSS